MNNEKQNDFSMFSEWFNEEMNPVNDNNLLIAARGIFKMYSSFVQAGFTEAQAFELVKYMVGNIK